MDFWNTNIYKFKLLKMINDYSYLFAIIFYTNKLKVLNNTERRILRSLLIVVYFKPLKKQKTQREWALSLKWLLLLLLFTINAGHFI